MENQDIIERADKAGDVAKKHVWWVERFIMVLIIVWLAVWHVVKDASYKTELKLKDDKLEKNNERLFDVIQYVGKPAATENIKEKDSLYKKRINEGL
jgi:hypothetical protein